MATVYLGRAVADGGFERLVAIKVMHPHIAEEPEFEAMFLDEARLAASIRHPNVVATIDVSKGEGAMFLVMDYVDGPALNRILRKLKEAERSIPIEITLRIIIDTLNGLDAAHHLKDANGQPLNLVHRDVSPQNILVGGDGIARLTDFGVARAEARLSMTTGGEIKGKLGYMPPEQSKGEAIDNRADVYAAGVVLWECLTHERMFAADNAGELIYRVLQGVQKSPSEINAEVPYHIDRVCMSALSLQVEHRYQSAADFAEALEDAALHDGVRIATTRQLARFIEDIRPLVGDPGEQEEESGRREFSSIAAPTTTPSTASGLFSGTGKPHAMAIKMVSPKQGRMVTALATVIALTIGVGAAGVLMLSQPVAADRVQSNLSGCAIENANDALTVLEAMMANEEAASSAQRIREEAEELAEKRASELRPPPEPEEEEGEGGGDGEGGAGGADGEPAGSASSTEDPVPAPVYVPRPSTNKGKKKKKKKGKYRPDEL
jgi:serine/threonine-protein kinase